MTLPLLCAGANQDHAPLPGSLTADAEEVRQLRQLLESTKAEARAAVAALQASCSREPTGLAIVCVSIQDGTTASTCCFVAEC